MFARKPKPETRTELLHRRYQEALKTLSDFQTNAAFFHHSQSPVSYESLCDSIDTLRKDFQSNVFNVLPSAKIY